MQKNIGLLLLALCWATSSWAADATFSWLPNSETYLAGYKIHCGTATAMYSKIVDVGKPATVAGRVSGKVTGLTDKTTYFCAATAYGTDAQQSDYSNEVTIATPPPGIAPPGDFKTVTVITTVARVNAAGRVVATTTIRAEQRPAEITQGTAQWRRKDGAVVTETIIVPPA